MTANIIEIFSSIQGEGLYVGARQIFLRLSGCNLTCNYCDTPVNSTPFCRVELNPGSGIFDEILNPLSPEKTIEIIARLITERHHSISITGGEPLISVNFLKELFPLIKNTGIPVYLETNGTLPDNLREIISLVDIISMDIKLPSMLSGSDYRDKHREFLLIATQKEVFVKLVITEHTSNDDIQQTALLIRDINPAIPLVLQPVTANDNRILPPNAKRVLDIQSMILDFLINVRVIPQTHKILGQL